MPSDKETIYTDLVDASTSVIDQLFEDTRVVEIGQDNWYPDLLFRQDTLIVHETAADATIQVPTKAEPISKRPGAAKNGISSTFQVLARYSKTA
jgi:hypothetical protein